MGVYRVLLPDTAKPEWMDIRASGNFRMEPGSDGDRSWDEAAQVADYGRFDPHYHDVFEYWFIHKGRGIIRLDGVDHKFQPGDIIAIGRNVIHDVVAACEGMIEGHWFSYPGGEPAERELPEGHLKEGWSGHIHPSAEDRDGHVIEVISEQRFEQWA
jgi:mannose-6-phosphate isomerase-like protein (cupin superfamily)